MVKSKNQITIVKKRKPASRKKITLSKASKARKGVRSTPSVGALSTSFGPVTTISTAPVAIGNSISGFKNQVLHSKDGCRVLGRDFAFSPIATGTTSTWTLVGGIPLTPACLPSTALRNFVQMYNRFKINRLAMHYITSSATSSTGDVLFYHSKQNSSQLPECTNSSFLPYVLSDSLTVLGPQWTNHTCLIEPKSNWFDTDLGMSALEPSLYSGGDVFLFSKTSTTDSPGYVIFDYDITFKELSVNPRAGILPISRAQWNPFAFSFSGASTAGSTVLTAATSTSGISGTTIVTMPGAVAGDIYELVLDVTNSTLTNTTAANFLNTKISGTYNSTTIKDGEVFYLIFKNGSQSYMYATLAQAVVDTEEIVAGATVTYSETIRGFAKYVTSINPDTMKAAY